MDAERLILSIRRHHLVWAKIRVKYLPNYY